jgi:hypothetical protein
VTENSIRTFERNPADRRRHQLWAATLLALAVLLWLLVLDVFLFTQQAGPAVAALSALACLPTTGFGLWVVHRLDRQQKEPWRLVLVATAGGAIVAGQQADTGGQAVAHRIRGLERRTATRRL